MNNEYLIYFGLLAFGAFLFYKNKGSIKPLANFKVLSNFTDDLTAKAQRGELDPVIGREYEIERLVQILSRRLKNNPLLIGEAGVGKTAIVEGLALRIITGDVPSSLQNKKIFKINLADVMSDTKYRGELEQRIKSIVDEVISSKREIILFVDEIQTLIQTKGTEGAMNASDIIKPALARGDLQLIGATTTEEFHEYLEKDSAFLRRFQLVEVKEPSVEQTIEILHGLKKQYEDHHAVKFSDQAILMAVELSNKYIKNRQQPDKSIDLLDEAGVYVNFRENDLPDSSLKLIRAAADEVHRRIKKAPIEIQNLMVQLEKLKKFQQSSKRELAKKNIEQEILKLTAEIENQERILQKRRFQNSLPIVQAMDIKHVFTLIINKNNKL